MSVFSRMENELQQINLSVEQKGPIDLEAFKSFTKFHQSILYLAFNVQMKLRRTILGDEFWEMLSRRRLKLSKGRYMSLTTILMIVSGRYVYCCCGCSVIAPVIAWCNYLPTCLFTTARRSRVDEESRGGRGRVQGETVAVAK
jgi:hypothetical protein